MRERLDCVGLFVLLLLGSVVGTTSTAQTTDRFTRQQSPRESIGRGSAHARTGYVWPYAKGPSYGGAADRSTRSRRQFRTVVGEFDLSSGVPGLPSELTTGDRLEQDGRQYFVIQFAAAQPAGDLLSELNSTIERHGGAIVIRLGDATVIARLTVEARAAVEQRKSELYAIEPYHAAFKLHPAIGRAPLHDAIRATSEVYDLQIRLFPGEDADRAALEIERLGGQVSVVYPDTVRAALHRSKLAQLAQLQAVMLVFEDLPLYPQAEETTTTIQTGRYNEGATPYHDAGIDGGGGGIAAGPQVLMVLDSGIQLDAGDLSDTRVSAGTPGMAHRKVRVYKTVDAFGGKGDLLGCDAATTGGFTHGHAVAATALGNATDVDPAQYGAPWTATDEHGATWKLDGVAPGAVLVAYDAHVTPAAGGCRPPDPLAVGDLYSGGASGSLGEAHAIHDARLFELAFAADSWVYDAQAMDIDQFLLDQPLAMVFVAVGNNGYDADNDGVPDEGKIGSPATAKNSLAIGASRAANDFAAGGQEAERAFFSAVGPSPGNRIAPLLMAPGDDAIDGFSGLSSEFVCRTADNDSSNPVECDVISGLEGTSFASAAAAGAGLLVRDYFAQGFYPDGTSSNPGNDLDLVPQISGAMLKSLLVASARFMTGDKPPSFSGAIHGGDNLSREYRFNNEQGYGRIQLDNALPLQTWSRSVSSLRVADGGIAGGVNHLPGLDGTIDTTSGEIDTTGFSLCGTQDELRVVLAWMDPPSLIGSLSNDLDLELVSPTGRIYHGNYFTDDDDRDGTADPITEECPGIDGSAGELSESPWSLPVCERADGTISPHDRFNLTEAVFLSPDPFADGTAGQIELGNWTLRVIAASGLETAQRYAVAIAGSLCTDSRVRLDRTQYSCNDSAVVELFEIAEPGDIDPDEGDVASRTTFQVLDSTGALVDEESGLIFFRDSPESLEFRSAPLPLSAGTAHDPGNGALDVDDGDTLRVIYAEVDSGGAPVANRLRIATAPVVCTPRIVADGVVFGQVGRDHSYEVRGGCERNARDQFNFGFPDQYMDADELFVIAYGFAYLEPVDLVNARVDLRCAIVDADSPADCAPGSDDCPDPSRSNNPSCDQRPSGGPGDIPYMTILGTPQTIGLVPSQAIMSLRFGIEMTPAIDGTPEVEMVLSIDGSTSGKSEAALVVTRHRLDVDELSSFYSTDFPTGGMEFVDVNNDELLDNPTTDNDDVRFDYRFETRVWSDLTAGGTKNLSLGSPWNFDTDDGGFRSGILAGTDLQTIDPVIAQWGEDLNFNGILDKQCDDDPSIICDQDTDCPVGPCVSIEDRDIADNGILDQAWGTLGGCGWQTRDPGAMTGGIWHTGRIYGTTGDCLVIGNNPGQCQSYEIVGGTGGVLSWREHLITPIMSKVNGADYQVEIVDWAWNQSIELPDSNVAWVWEFDTDTTKLEPVDLYSDNSVLNGLFGPYGAVGGRNNPALTNGYSMFAPLDQNGDNWNGSLGNNRVGQNACFFEGGTVDLQTICPDCPTATGNLGVARPLDDDLDNDNDGAIDEYVTWNGPIRNMDIDAVNGPDMRAQLLEDLYGDTGEFFQASVGIWNFERTALQATNRRGYGVGIDDMVIQWREFTLTDDATSCSSGECAVVYLQTYRFYESNAVASIMVIERSPAPFNDCDLDGTVDATNDCDGNGIPDVVVRVTTEFEPDGEVVVLNRATNPIEYRGELPMSSAFDAPGILYVAQYGQELFRYPGASYIPRRFSAWSPPVTVSYTDLDDGTGSPCDTGSISTDPGTVTAVSQVELPAAGDVRLLWTELSDNGDRDPFADSNETIELRLRLLNKGEDVSGLTASIRTDDPKIDCILRPTIFIGDLAAGEERLTSEALVFRIADVDRTGSGLTDLDDFSVTFDVIFSPGRFDVLAGLQSFTLDLDLDLTGGACHSPSGCSYVEDWEGLPSVNCLDEAIPGDPSTAGQACLGWQAVNKDEELQDIASVDGYRCQYSDPDWINSLAYAGGVTDCFLAANPIHASRFWWQINSPADADGGRAYSGSNSLYMGDYGDGADTHTTPVSVLEWLQMADPVDLAADMPAPILSFKQQVDFMDSRNVNVVVGQSPSRGIVQLQMADQAGDPVGNWIKLYPYVNFYDQQAQDQYFSCSFDPIDDGNTEDSFFDPTDPDRRLGPSSTCYPEKAFVRQGETFTPFGVPSSHYGSNDDLGLAEGPGLEGEWGIGTWVEPRFDLSRFRGRRVRLRFLYTDLKAGAGLTWETLFQFNPSPGDDGWWIDDIQISHTLDEPGLLVNDDRDNAALPGCGNTCNVVDAQLAADPSVPLAAPGHVVELDALNSTADRCLGGILQFRYWQDGDGDMQPGGAQDTVLRSWSESPLLVQAPLATTTYVAEVRCSSDASCVDSASIEVRVTCPSSGRLSYPTVFAIDSATLDWGQTIAYDYAQGPLAGLAGYVTDETGQDAGIATGFSISSDNPAADEGIWYLFRESQPLGSGATGYCNAPGVSWGNPARDAALP